MTRRVALVPVFVAALLATPAVSAQSPTQGGVLRIADREAPNLDPHQSVSFLTHSWANMVYLPTWPQHITHAPRVKGFKHHDGFSLGHRLMFTWVEP